MASKLLIKISKSYVIKRQVSIKNGNLENPLRPKTPEDEYRDLFNKAMGPDYFLQIRKQVEKLNKRTKGKEFGECGQTKISGLVKKRNEGCGNTNKSEPRTMRALVLDVKERKIELSNVFIPNTLKKDEVSIKVRYAGNFKVSGFLVGSNLIPAANFTDLCILEGKIPSNQKTIIPGRELSGVVLGTGDEVDHVRVGDQVVISPCQPNTLCP